MKKTILTLMAVSVLMPWGDLFLQAQDYRPNPEGYLMERYGVTAWQEEMINWYSWIRSRELDSLKTLDLVPQEYRKERDSVTYIYYARIGRILTEEQKSKFDPEAFKAAKAKEIRILGLPVVWRCTFAEGYRCGWTDTKTERRWDGSVRSEQAMRKNLHEG